MNCQSAQIEPDALVDLIVSTIKAEVVNARSITTYREPLVGFCSAEDPKFKELCSDYIPAHYLPGELIEGAKSVVSFFIPFDSLVVKANSRDKHSVAQEWAQAYVDTNSLISRITRQLISELDARGILSAAEPATHNFDPLTLKCRWSHKSIAVIAGLGSFGLHNMVITDSGCAGRFGSLVIDRELPVSKPAPKNRCLYFKDKSCRACVERCPTGALKEDGSIDKQACYARLLEVAEIYKSIGVADVCGKCALGPCSLKSPVS